MRTHIFILVVTSIDDSHFFVWWPAVKNGPLWRLVHLVSLFVGGIKKSLRTLYSHIASLVCSHCVRCELQFHSNQEKSFNPTMTNEWCNHFSMWATKGAKIHLKTESVQKIVFIWIEFESLNRLVKVDNFNIFLVFWFLEKTLKIRNWNV